MKQRTTKLLAELKILADGARENIWKRISLAKEVLADHDWIATCHDGSDLKARDAIQDDFFYELNGTFTLGALLAIHEAYPREADWKAVKYNLQAMRALWEEGRKKEKNPVDRKSPVPRKDFDELTQRLEQQVSRTESLAEENSRLREEIARLREENAVLRGRLMEHAA